MTGSKERIVVSEHARAQAHRRGIEVDLVLQVVRFPEQRLIIRTDREIRQSRIEMPPGGTLYLLRTIVEIGQFEVTVVTVYRTSQIRKYWSIQ